jgi:hypothetical protein
MTKHVPKYTSIDLTYDILGKAAFVDDISVVIVNTVVTPSATLAGVAFRLSQNDTHLSSEDETSYYYSQILISLLACMNACTHIK